MNLEALGAHCHVTKEDGREMYLGCGSKSLLSTVCQYYHIDYVSLRRSYELYAFRHLNVPLFLPTRDLVLVPVRTRKASSHNENVSGYVANTAIDELEPLAATQTRIYLKTGLYLDASLSLRSVRDRIARAEQFAYRLRRNQIM